MPSPLGRRVPTNFNHVSAYPMRAAIPFTVDLVEKKLSLSRRFKELYNQGREGACVGHSCSFMMSILNRYRYDAWWLWDRAKETDEWADTNPGDGNGTSVRAACDVLRDKGHCRVWAGKPWPVDKVHGIVVNRWATSVDQVRTSISQGIPVVLGVNWYTGFDRPEKRGNNTWIGHTPNWGNIRGGHAICCFGASDNKQGVWLVNSWGESYPNVVLPYTALTRLLSEDGEACLVTDR